MYECRNCGGELRFDIPTQKLICAHCDGQFDPDDYDRDLFAEADKFEVNVFKCPNCGGEITSTTLSAVEYCPYCGRFSMPASVKEEQKMPEGIMPFEITADQAKESFKKYIGRNFYAPSKLKDDSFLNGFRGLYLPFWSYDISFSKKPTLNKSYEHRSGDYIVKDTYEFTGDMDASYEGVTFDASSRFEDDLSRQTMPYERAKVKPFNPSYMFGFYGETADVGPELYENDAAEVASREVFRQIDESFPEDELEYPANSFSKAYSLGARTDKAACVMAPVWFLTWRHHNNVAYSVVNGQTGKTYSDIPVSITKFMIGTLLMTLPLFALFYFLLPTPSIYTMLLLVSLIGVAALLIYKKTSLELFIIREHLRDRGYLAKHPSEYDPNEFAQKVEGVKKSIKKINLSNALWIAILFVSFGGVNVIGLALMMTRRRLRGIGYMIMLCVMVYTVIRIFSSKASADKGRTLRDISGAVIALVIAFLIHLSNPARDVVYYLAALLVIGGVLWTLLMLIRQYNDIATHPDPHFFEGKAAGAALGLALLILGAAGAAGVTGAVRTEPAYADGYEIVLKPAAETEAFEGVVYENKSTGFVVRIQDDAGLIREHEKSAVISAMIPVTEYGNAGFYSKTNGNDTERDSRSVYQSWFGTSSGTVFLIDMASRNIWIHSDGAVYKTVTKEWADMITDNTYRLATAGRYGDCVKEVFRQIRTRLEGGRVNSGLKVGTGLLIAFLVSMLLNYMLILRSRNKRSAPEILAPLMGASAMFVLTGTARRHAATNRRYSPVSSGGGSGGSGGGGFSGGGGGGGFSGGGGGHGF